jgi:hypothetical protein
LPWLLHLHRHLPQEGNRDVRKGDPIERRGKDLTLTLALTLLFLERKLDRVYSGSYTLGDAAGGRKKKGGLGGDFSDGYFNLYGLDMIFNRVN